MPGGEKRKDEGIYGIEDMSSDELRAILVEDLNCMDADKLSSDEIKHIVGILKRRESEEFYEGTDIAEAPVNSQHQHFQENSGAEVVQNELTAGNLLPADTSVEAPKKDVTYILRKHVLLRIAVAVMCLLIIGGVAASALQLDFLSVFKTWTEELFQVRYSESPDPIEVTPSGAVDETALAACVTASEAVSVLGISQPLLPAQIMPEFSPTEFKVSIFSDRTTVYEYYENAKGISFSITIDVYTQLPSGESSWYQKDDIYIESFISGGIEHHIMSNLGTNTAVWTIENCECAITGNLNVDELKAMIDSIYK